MSAPNMLTWAQRYRALGYHPIPVAPRTKRPLVPWKDYQTTPPSDAQITEWWSNGSENGIALVLGRGVFAVDLDGGKPAEDMLAEAGVTLPADAPRSRTGSGYHVLLSAHQPVGDRVGLLSTNGGKPQVDIRGVGIIIAPPSIHPSGRRYEWEVPPVEKPPAAPQPLLGLLAQRAPVDPPERKDAQPGESWVQTALRGVGQGLRDATCTKLAGYFVTKRIDAETVVSLLASSYGPACTPPFPEKDIRKCVESVARKHGLQGDDVAIAPKHISVVLRDMETEINQRGNQLVQTPFAELNDATDGGFAKGELIFLGARPGIGKTALGLEFARSAAKTGTSVLIVSREMRTTALARRMVSQDSRVPASVIKRAAFNDLQSYEYLKSVEHLKGLPIWLTDELLSIEQLAQVMGEMRQLGLVIVDYLQLMRAPREIKERRHQVEHVSSGLKQLALTYHVPILCLSSLSRPGGDKSPRPPVLADLRESGELEHDADIILFLHRQYREEETSCIVAKNRDGRLTDLALLFRADCVAFDQAQGVA